MLTPRRGRGGVRPELAHAALLPLPLPLVLAVAGCLPADDKLRLALISPAFRAVADETSLWRDVRLGFGSGVGRVTDALLRAVSAKARGTMRSLNVSGRLGANFPALSVGAVAAVCFANTALEQLDVRCDDPLEFLPCLSHKDVVRLLAAVPRLRRLDADVQCYAGGQAHTVLSNPAVRVRRLAVGEFEDAASLTALLVDLEGQPEVTQLELFEAPLDTAPALDSVVTFALTRRLAALRLDDCSLDAASVPALARLLLDGDLVSFEVIDNGAALPLSPAFVAAVHAPRLQRLALSGVRLFDDMDAGLASLAAVTGHTSLRHFIISANRAVAPGVYTAAGAEARLAEVGSALGRLVAASAPLVTLDVSFCHLGDDGLRPLVIALPANTRLRSLDIVGNELTPNSEAWVLAAVQANTSLRKLRAKSTVLDFALAQAENLVAARAQAGAGA